MLDLVIAHFSLNGVTSETENIVADGPLLQWNFSSLKARTRSLTTILYSNNMKQCFVQLKQAVPSCFETSILLGFKIITVFFL